MKKLWVAALLGVLALSCGDSKPAGPPELTVFAAVSLREACGELGAAYEKQHGAKVVFNFGASNALAQQITASRKGDVFISADEAQMDAVASASLVDAATRAKLLSNQLVVVQPKPRGEGVVHVTSADKLADASIARLSLANTEAVPAGTYAKAWLETKGLWSTLEARVVPGVDVRAALATVESGAAQAGIVYATDAAIAARVEVTLRVPLSEGPAISYPIAALTCSNDAAAARAFVDFARSGAARGIFERHGFIVLPSAANVGR